MDTIELENLVKECNRLKKIMYENRESMSNLNFILSSGAIRAENAEIGDDIVIDTADDVRRILQFKVDKIEARIKELVSSEKST